MLIMHGNKTLSLFSCHIVDIRPGQRLMQISLELNIMQMVIKLQTILIYGCGIVTLWNMVSGTGTYISFNI